LPPIARSGDLHPQRARRFAHRDADREEALAELGRNRVAIDAGGKGDDALEWAAVDLQPQRFRRYSGRRRSPHAGDAQATAFDGHLELGLLDARQLGDDGDAVADPVHVEAWAPAGLQAIARRGGETEYAFDEVVDALVEPLEVFVPAEGGSGHGA